jgi:Zn-dependent M28 family amino/carboxypeptidase
MRTPSPAPSLSVPALLALLSLSACATHAITADELMTDVRALADDSFEGRGPGTRGDTLAREYIAAQLAAAGCEPAAPGGGWHQDVTFLGITSAVTRSLTARGSAGEAAFQAPDDFTAVAGSPAPAAEWRDAELVFVGYGITAPEQQWDDFGDTDVRGKVLLVMNDDPAEDPARFGGKSRLYYGRWTYKYEEAARRGALGAIVIHTAPSAGYPFHVIQAQHGREAFWLPFREGVPTLAVRAWASEDAAKKLCALGGHDLDALRAAAASGAPRPVPLGVTVDLAIANSTREVHSANVVGRMRGSDPKLRDEHVVVTAHWDHLGVGKPRGDDAIYNGAVDNATGCAGMLALARAWRHVDARRSVLFVAVTAEESGLLGSEFFVANAPVPVSALVANFNVDGLNVWGPTEDIEFIGHGKNSLTRVAEAVAKERGRRIEADSNPDLGLFYRSDHFNFARAGVPAAYFKAGNDFHDRPEDRRRMKASFTTVHYHQPSDEVAPWWNLAGAVADLEVLLECMVRVCNADARPTWTPGDEFANAR